MLQNGVIPLPKSTNPEHIKQNLEIDFEISATDMKYLDHLTYTVKGMFLSKIKGKVKKRLIAIETSIKKLKILPGNR
jgi:diketogulonate reductase-like aldo/keto reductase